MKTTRRLFIAVVVLVLAGCNLWNGTVPQPASGTPGSPEAASTDKAGAAETARPTLPAVEAASTLMPNFDGLYWTPGLLVDGNGDAARVLAGMPCGQVLALLSSGQWRLTKQIPNNQQAGDVIPAMALMERNGEQLLLKLKDINPSGTPSTPTVGDQAATATPTPDPALPTTLPGTVDPINLTGCQVTITKIIPQAIEAHGVEEVQGTALVYPLMADCLISAGDAMVGMFYVGPGDFRAFLGFDTSNAVGEYPINTLGLSLVIFHSPLSMMEFMAQVNAADANSSTDSLGTKFDAGSDNPGTVTVRSVDPLAGEIRIDSLVDESGNTQTFRAGFRCGW
jgi:hypothetical protein